MKRLFFVIKDKGFNLSLLLKIVVLFSCGFKFAKYGALKKSHENERSKSIMYCAKVLYLCKKNMHCVLP